MLLDALARSKEVQDYLDAIIDNIREQILEEEVAIFTEKLLIEALSIIHERANEKRRKEMEEAGEGAERIHGLMVRASVQQNTGGVAHPAEAKPNELTLEQALPPVPKPKRKPGVPRDWNALTKEFTATGATNLAGFLRSKGVPVGNAGYVRELLKSKWKCGIDGYLELTKLEADEHSAQLGHALELVEEDKA